MVSTHSSVFCIIIKLNNVYDLLLQEFIQMKTALPSLTGSGINTDRISVASKQRALKNETTPDNKTSAVQTSSFKREVPIPQNAGFVEADGKKYYLNAPRGTYLNILV